MVRKMSVAIPPPSPGPRVVTRADIEPSVAVHVHQLKIERPAAVINVAHVRLFSVRQSELTDFRPVLSSPVPQIDSKPSLVRAAYHHVDEAVAIDVADGDGF